MYWVVFSWLILKEEGLNKWIGHVWCGWPSPNGVNDQKMIRWSKDVHQT